MELILKNGLPHQEKAIDAISNVFTENSFKKNTFYFANPTLEEDKATLLEQIKKVQNEHAVDAEYINLNGIENYLNLDIKMETGTGKTYVQVATIFELHKKFKINKFIIVGPHWQSKQGQNNLFKTVTPKNILRTFAVMAPK